LHVGYEDVCALTILVTQRAVFLEKLIVI